MTQQTAPGRAPEPSLADPCAEREPAGERLRAPGSARGWTCSCPARSSWT
ncbi:hypothetical protein [Actinomadura madurae]|nr:hypothetical protein [Actinomadura madurae]MCQ0011759.1 hypothetical protein [Actinomadura madurae]